MVKMNELIKKHLPLTLGDIVEIATETDSRFVDVVLAETEIQTGLSRDEILEAVMKEFEHNLYAADMGLQTQESVLMGSAALDLAKIKGTKLFKDKFVDDAIFYTIAAQAGNHAVGLNPCAGTGDSCPYTGIIKAMQQNSYDELTIAETTCIMLKVGAMFRVGKTSTGCNMEGYGAGSAAVAAAITFLYGGSPKDMERAMVIAISPTIAVPCTPRVMVPALCATHIAGAITNGVTSAGLAVQTDIEVNVPIDVMIAVAADVHPISAKYVVPVLVDYLQPFFKRKEKVERLISNEIKAAEEAEGKAAVEKAKTVAKRLAKGARPITNTLGEAVVGGSSQAVGSPTNCGRIVHALSSGTIKKVIIELYPELFARRGINVPGILMGAVYGASTGDGELYRTSVERVTAAGIEVEIKMVDEYQAQRVTLETDEGTFCVDSLNRGGGRLVIRDATPSKEAALQAAERLGIVVVD